MIKKKLLLLGLMLGLFLPGLCRAQTLQNITTPLELSLWLSREFKYQTEMPDYWQSAEETLNLKTGDCEDFAILSQTILKSLSIPSEILIIKFKGLNLSHTICIFKDKGLYSFISNQKLIRTQANTIIAAVEEQYPDWENIIFTDAQKRPLKVLAKTNSPTSIDKHLITSLNK